MRLKVALFLSLLCDSIVAQENLLEQDQAGLEVPEEIVVTGERSNLQLRLELMELEKQAYELFNQFNDERRFDISCSVQKPTGSNLSRQVCQPEFEIQATRAHAQDFLESIPQRREGLPQASAAPTFSATPMEFEINRHQKAFRQKMQDVAKQHPEFLEALKAYAELRTRYEERTNAISTESE